MPSVKLRVASGPMKGREFAFSTQQVFMFGRDPDCHAQLLEQDDLVSRFHFALDVSPPLARLSDLGSLNGTYVNGVRCGGRDPSETPDQARQRRPASVDLKNGDVVEIGDTRFEIEVIVDCSRCNAPVMQSAQAEAPVCAACRSRVLVAPTQLRGAAAREAPPAAAALAATDLSLGDVPLIAGYVIEKKLGEGGMGRVYLARRQNDGLRVAVKVLLDGLGDEMVMRFGREVLVNVSLQHPNIVRALEGSALGHGYYLVLEYCELGSIESYLGLNAELEPGKPPPPPPRRLRLDEALPIFTTALEGLAFAHHSGIVHRDIKPANILLASPSHAKIGDLGLAKSFIDAAIPHFTATGRGGGSLAYMPIEQGVDLKRVGPAGDVYATGVTMFQILTGGFPRDPMRIQDHCVPISERAAEIPARVADVIDRACAFRAESRWPDAKVMLEALRRSTS